VTRRTEIQSLPLWGELAGKRRPLGFELELTARCNNDCRHCYINVPAGDASARAAELTTEEVLRLGREAAELGAVWCLVTGGEPLLRDDFAELFVGLKRLGLLVSVFTNACLVTPELVDLFRRYPARDVEVSVYGATRATYETVTRRPGSYERFVHGLDLLSEAGVPVRLKAMALRSTLGELDQIARFCRARTKDYFRFDPLLHLRFDGDPARNAEIRAERLTPAEIVALERDDEQRFAALRRECEAGEVFVLPADEHPSDLLFRCGAGTAGFTVGYEGTFRLCSALWHRETVFSLRADPERAGTLRPGALREAWETWVTHVRGLRGARPGFLERCARCDIVNLCLWCPAHAALETGDLDEWVEYFCAVAHARADALRGAAQG
jgi:MoaA/NifB/PqqE/SkfB family radical SAM enzyme